MPYTLVVCEKPDAARRIAQALGDAKVSRQAGVPVFDVDFDGVHYKICSASGHLYGVTDATRNRKVYPVLDLEWAPLEKKARLIGVISKLSQGASDFIHACDYDQEGEVIGHSILEYACGHKYAGAMRARFSTLTDDEVRESFRDLQKPSGGLAEAGRSRHLLDFLYGVNLSRALAQAFMAGNKGYRNLSIGRVQGPALAFATDRELEIRLHVPDPYWVVTADFDKDGRTIHARYEPQVGALAEAQKISGDCTGRDGTVSKTDIRKVMLAPPAPFNTGDLQREVYRLFRVAPGYTLAVAEKLYLRALISYPRTSSQKLPPSINYRRILSGLAGLASYGRPASMLLASDRLVPHEGPATDPAHPAIYPTGLQGRLSGLEFKIYDLVVRRFLATFGDAAVTERTEVAIDVQGHRFVAESRITLYDGWMVFYRPYVSLEQPALPELREGDRLANREVVVEEKFTQPPARYSQATLLARMEQEQIGTKATRADIISTLFRRGYIEAGRGGVQATDLGLAVVESMRLHAPAIVSTDLTRSMEEQLERVEQGAADPAAVIGGAADRLVESLAAFRGKEEEIGRSIGATAQSDNAIGRCPLCKEGQLRMIRSRTTRKRFVGCSRYASGCRASAPLPQRGAVRHAGVCKCGWPKIAVAFGRGRRWKTCVNMQCPFKQSTEGA